MAARTARKSASSRGQDAIKMLKDDHKKVKKLFADFERIKDSGKDKQKEALIEQICQEIKVHAELEETIFYPAVRRELDEDDRDVMDEALVEHAGAKDLIEQLEQSSSGDELRDAKVTVLGEQIKHHVKEEEGEMFPKVRKARVDVKALGETMATRKQALLRGAGATSRGRKATAEDSLGRSA